MIGIFDSGDGGRYTLEIIKRIAPDADVCFLADEKNAPYGTKSEKEILRITSENIKRLKEAGADKVLIACCTASTVYPLLTDEEKSITLPIIDATARLALKTSKKKRICVIATEATARSGAFEKSILSLSPDAKVTCYAAQSLVALVESGVRDGRITDDERGIITASLEKIKNEDFDTLILGCTHFPRLEKTIRSIVARPTVSSALAGAHEVVEKCGVKGSGRCVFI